MEPFVGEIRLLPFNFAPRNWALCDGQLIAIQSNTALFSIIGTTYGGDGRTTFALPNLQGRAVTGVGQGPGLSDWRWGEAEGENSVALSPAEMPAHNHTLTGYNNPGSAATPAADSFLARDTRAGGVMSYMLTPGAVDAQMAANTLGVAGRGEAHENRQPLLAVNYCIALTGIFPVRP